MDFTDKNTDIPDFFPFPFTPYDIQNQFMQKLYYVVENGKLGIFESPTGTGKSLSIICGVLKWLKDHQNYERNTLSNSILKLEKAKEKLSEDTKDWLSVQSEQLQISQKLVELKLQQGKIEAYDNKINELQKNVKKLEKFKTRKVTKPNLENENIISDEDTDDVLLEELNMDNEEFSSDEETQDNTYEPTKIYISSRTHSQLTQFVGEIIKSPFGKDIRVTSLASRQNYCINPEVKKLKSIALINEKCLDMQKKSSAAVAKDSEGRITKKKKSAGCQCPFYKQQAIDDLRDWALIEVQDIESLVQNGKELHACPYYASRKAAGDAEIVLVPYNTLLHKATREANGIVLKNNVVIIDEAHNLLEAMAQMYCSELSHNQVYQSLHQLKSYKQRYGTRLSAKNLLSINQLIFVTNKLLQMLDKECKNDLTDIFTVERFVLAAGIDNYNMFKLIKFCKESRIAQKLRIYSINYEAHNQPLRNNVKTGIANFLASIKNTDKIISKETREEDKKEIHIPNNPLLAVISFLESLTYPYEDGRILLTNTVGKVTSHFQFLLLNPSSNFKDIVKEARSVIVAGGTMKPMSEFQDRLFINAGANLDQIVQFSCEHIIPPDHILPIIVTKGPNNENILFNFENRMSMGSYLKTMLHEVCRKIKGGIVVFFPSYKYENWFVQQLGKEKFGRPLFREPQNSGSVDYVLENYADTIKKSPNSGALLFSVVGGKLSEGLNFSDDLGRCIIVIGMPYANIMAADLKEKMSYLERKEGYGAGQKFYENLCMKAVNQCIGRAVRHKNDYAVVLLLDERFSRQSTKTSLPGWIQRSLEVCNHKQTFTLIEKFFETKNANK